VLGQPPVPVLAQLESRLPVGEQWRYEPKLDGFRGALMGQVQLLNAPVCRPCATQTYTAAWFPVRPEGVCYDFERRTQKRPQGDGTPQGRWAGGTV